MSGFKVIIILLISFFINCRTLAQQSNSLVSTGFKSSSYDLSSPIPSSQKMSRPPFTRGINLSDWLENFTHISHLNFNRYNKEDFENIKSLGCDHIRLPIELFYMTGSAPDYIINPLLYMYLDQAVDWAEELQLYLILDNHSFDMEMGEEYLDQLLAVWMQLAERYKDRSEFICYDILNEPHGITDALWNDMQQQTINTIRSIDQKHTIIVGPANWNDLNHLDLMSEFSDTNLIYTFHFYDPGLFTHQGSYWVTPDMTNISGIPYPYDADRMPEMPAEYAGTWVEQAFDNYPSVGNDAWIQSRLDIAVQFMNDRQVPLWCGEFGSYKPNCQIEDRTRWLELVRSYLEANNISWTMWEYADGFGIFEEDRELFNYDVNIPVIEALGLTSPPQEEFQQMPDSTGMIIYDDFLSHGIFHSDWNPNGFVNYCTEDDPIEGNYYISWTEADQYSGLGFRFSPIRDFTELESENYLLDLWISCDNSDAEINIRFIDTDTDDPNDHPWRMGYIIDSTDIPFNGTWQHVQIPFSSMTEQGSWDGEWFPQQGLFDWSKIELLNIATDHQSLQGMVLSIDYIRIVAPSEVPENYQNPVIPGFHPDPSICRAGDNYYLVTSTFEYFPGVPIFHSKDLVHWRQIGHCLTRKSQLNLDNASISGGIFAPTIRYHDGTFYMITSNFTSGGNFYVTATNPEGPWSEPVFINDWHMDPSLLFDDDGTVYMTYHEGGESGHIAQRILDINTGQLQGTGSTIWNGTGCWWPEGPHLYKINGMYYLMIAECGTAYDHKETIARSDSPWGPFTAYSGNPIVTHQNRPGHPIQAVGHADLVETPDEWWMVSLGIRPKGGNYHHLGRETFLAPVSWNSEGWPVVNDSGSIELTMPVIPSLTQHEWPAEPVRDDFNSTTLNNQWNFVRNPYDADWSLTERYGFLRLNGSAVSLNDQNSPAFVGRRQDAFNCLATTHLEFTPVNENEEAGLIIRGNDNNHYEIGISMRSGNRVAFFRSVLEGQTIDSVFQQIPDGHILLRAYATEYDYQLSYQVHNQSENMLGRGLTRNMSSEIIGGFTGTYIGMFATGNGQENTNPADFDWFDYEVDPEPDLQTPYSAPAHIPGQVEAENYDQDGAGIAYWDSDAGNMGGQYRSDDVDIEVASDTNTGYDVGWTEDGEWMEYTVDADNGIMGIEVRVASDISGILVVVLDGETLCTYSIPNTGGWQSWQTLTIKNIPIEGGQNKILRLQIVDGGFNINWIRFTTSEVTHLTDNLESSSESILKQNYPNPFDLSTTISYTIKKSTHVNLEIYSSLGKQVKVLVDVLQPAGEYNVSLQSAGLPDGVYFYCLRAGDYSITRKLIIQK